MKITNAAGKIITPALLAGILFAVWPRDGKQEPEIIPEPEKKAESTHAYEGLFIYEQNGVFFDDVTLIDHRWDAVLHYKDGSGSPLKLYGRNPHTYEIPEAAKEILRKGKW